MSERALAALRNRSQQDQRIVSAIRRERTRLLRFVRQRVANDADVEDILQDVFSELVEAYRLLQPIEEVGAWLFRVARNRIIDRFRKKQAQSFSQPTPAETQDGEFVHWEDLLPSPDAGPEAVYARAELLGELEAALDELPEEQREVFLAHEVDGRSFKDLSAETGVSVNTLLSRKRYAVLSLRRRLQAIYNEFRNTWR